jgi:rhodanese-related sulfurtransferase
MGSTLWAGTGIAIGAFFHTSVDQLLDILSTMGTTALIVLGVLLALFVAFKYVERKRFRQSVDIERITIDDFKQMMEQGHEPILVDARSATAQMLDPAVPGAVLFNGGELTAQIVGLDKGRHIIVYCSCPNDVTAAHVAKNLIGQGYHLARPLHGGLEAWNAAFRSETLNQDNTASA